MTARFVVGERMIDRVFATPAASTGSRMTNGKPLDSGAAMRMSSDLANLCRERCRPLFQSLGTGPAGSAARFATAGALFGPIRDAGFTGGTTTELFLAGARGQPWDPRTAEAFPTLLVPDRLTGRSTTIAAGSNGAALPQLTVNVVSTAGFPASGTFRVNLISTGLTQIVTYTGKNPTSFTNCVGGVGTMALGDAVLPADVGIGRPTLASVRFSMDLSVDATNVSSAIAFAIALHNDPLRMLAGDYLALWDSSDETGALPAGDQIITATVSCDIPITPVHYDYWPARPASYARRGPVDCGAIHAYLWAAWKFIGIGAGTNAINAICAHESRIDPP